MNHTYGVDSETGRLRAVLAHRPGAELRRITPRDGHRLLFHGLPWVAGAQAEHDTLCEVLAATGVGVRYVLDLLTGCLADPLARHEAIASAVCERGLGARLSEDLTTHLAGLDSDTLAQVLVGGLAVSEFRRGRGVVHGLLDRHDFLVPPLPHLVFTRDASLWTGPLAVVASLRSEGRQRECALMDIVYRHHPEFAGTSVVTPSAAPLHGGDLVWLAPGALAAGISERTSPAAVERLATRLFADGLAWTVLAVPTRQAPPGSRLDTVCTVIDASTLLMSPALAYTLQAQAITPADGGPRVSPPRPFLEAAAEAMGAGPLTVISTGVEPPAASSQQWDDGGNALMIEPGLAVCHERNTETIARLETAGVGVIRVPGSELGGGRGGPRAMICPVARDPAGAGLPLPPAAVSGPALPAGHPSAPQPCQDLPVVAAVGEFASLASPAAAEPGGPAPAW